MGMRSGAGLKTLKDKTQNLDSSGNPDATMDFSNAGLGLSEIHQINAEQAMMIIVLEANASISPESYDKAIADKMEDSDGYDNTIDTANTIALYDSTNKYYDGLVVKEVGVTGNSSGFDARVTYTKITADRTGTINALSVNFDVGTNGNVKLGLYGDSSGSPGALLNNSSSVASVAGWNKITIPDTSVTNGTDYWIALRHSSSSDTIHRETGLASGSVKYATLAYASAWDDPATGLTASTYALWSRLNYDLAGVVQTNNLTSSETSTITKVYVAGYGTNIANVTVDISCDDGSTFTSGSALNTEITTGFGTGNDIILKFNLDSGETLKTYGVLYWT